MAVDEAGESAPDESFPRVTSPSWEVPALIRLLLTASIRVRAFLRTWMPSNIVLDLIRRRQNLKWGIPAMLLAVPYLAVAYWCRAVIEDGAPGWLNVIVLICLWSALKFIIMGPVSVVLLVQARAHERADLRALKCRATAQT